MEGGIQSIQYCKLEGLLGGGAMMYACAIIKIRYIILKTSYAILDIWYEKLRILYMISKCRYKKVKTM